MATVVRVGDSQPVPDLHFMEPDKGENVKGAQADAVQLATMLSGMKRAESMEVLHLTLHQCARDGDMDSMQRLLRSMAGNVRKKVNAADDEGLTALHYASRYNHYGVVRQLVEAGGNVNCTDEEGASPLHFAARYKRMRLTQIDDNQDEETRINPNVPPAESTVENSVIIFLVHAGADPNLQDMYGCTPLHFAAMRGNEIATKELLSCKGINIEVDDKQLMTPLHLAASHNEVEVVRMLIDSGANLRCKDEDDGTPLHFACQEGSEDVARLLFEAGEKVQGWVTVSDMVNDQDSDKNNALHLAVENGSYNVSKMCIEKGADINSPRSNYFTPLHLAAVSGELSIVQLLLNNNARIDALDITQQTPLHIAAKHNHYKIVEYLIARGAHVNKHDKDNFSPLLLAASQGHSESIKSLLNNHAKLHDVDKQDKTAIYWAAEEDNLEALQVLLEYPLAKRILDFSDRYDDTPLCVAAKKGHLSCLKALLDAGADIDAKNEEEQSPLHLAAKHGKTNVVRELVKRDKKVINDEDEDSNTALHLAATAGHNKVVMALIDCGADIEARNCKLYTPLDLAAQKGWAKTCRVLLEADAPVDPMDKTKTTPLHLASRYGHASVVNLLLQWHANVCQRDIDGNNCLDLAIDNGNKDVAMTIIQSNRWQEALMNETMELSTGMRQTPMRKLIRKMPDVAEKVFYRCTTSNSLHQDHPDYQIQFNYEFLDDMYSNWQESDQQSDALSSTGSTYDEDDHLTTSALPYTNDSTMLKENHPLMIMVKSNQEDLLAHPLVTSLLRHKWNSFGRYVYYANFLTYCVFLVFLTGYVVISEAPFHYTNNGTRTCNPLITNAPPLSYVIFVTIGKFIIIALAAVNLLRELFQIFKAKLNYLGWENVIEWITYVSSILLVIDLSECRNNYGIYIRLEWQWELGAVAIFLAWLDLVLFIRKFPRFGIYVVMFTDILNTFIQFFPVFFLFVVSFALGFYVLLQNQLAFSTPPYSMLKTVIMMIGEFEYTTVFHGTEDLEPPTDSASRQAFLRKDVLYKGTTYTLFVVFVSVMTILIMNLLVGLAVDDIKAVQEQAVLKRLAMQVELALDVEGVLPQFIRRRFVIRCKTIQPNDKSHSRLKRLLRMEASLLSATAITKALNPELDEYERIEENQEKMKTQINLMRFKIKQLNTSNQKLEAMISALLKHHNIDYSEEDAAEENELGLAN